MPKKFQGLDAGITVSRRWRSLRRMAIFLFGIALFAETYGTPYLRLSYVEMGGFIRSGTYAGLQGTRTLVAGEVAQTCPLIALVPLEHSLTHYAFESWEALYED